MVVSSRSYSGLAETYNEEHKEGTWILHQSNSKGVVNDGLESSQCGGE